MFVGLVLILALAGIVAAAGFVVLAALNGGAEAVSDLERAMTFYGMLGFQLEHKAAT